MPLRSKAANYTKNAPRQGAPNMLRSTAIAERIRMDRAARQGQSIGFFDWAMKVPEPKAGTLNFDIFPFQKELYAEGAHEKEMVVQKATQIGVSASTTRLITRTSRTQRCACQARCRLA
jgi:hypothetical protein